MKNFKINKYNFKIKSFSLIEVLIAAAILAMASISIFQLFNFTTYSTISIYNNSVALNLARITLEQIEAFGASKFEQNFINEVKTERNKFIIEVNIIKLSKVFSEAYVFVKYKQHNREVKINLASLVYN